MLTENQVGKFRASLTAYKEALTSGSRREVKAEDQTLDLKMKGAKLQRRLNCQQKVPIPR